MDHEILTAADVAKFLRIPKTTVYDLAQRGRLPAFKVGRHWRFRKTRIEQWLERQENGSISHRSTIAQRR